jgi:8-oxo-dGTP diphosphatase
VEVVRAAGGVVLADGEVLLVHRPRYDDWSLPKGKLLPGETDEEAALREVEEETGLVCRLGAELATSEYVDARGRPKVVRYWLMEPVDGVFEPHDEVDEVRWLPLDRVDEQLSYERDRVVLRPLRARSS